MDETPYFDCSQLKVLVLDEADRILDMVHPELPNSIYLSNLNYSHQMPKKVVKIYFAYLEI